MHRSVTGCAALVLIAACDPAADPSGVAGSPDAILSAQWTAGTVAYDAVPSPFPGSWPSVSFHASRADEWGDHVRLTAAGTLDRVTVGLSSWACENDATRERTEACVSTPGATFSHPITLNLYEVDATGPDPALGALIASRTTTFQIPFRPSWDGDACQPAISNTPFGGQWFDPVLGRCVDGFAFTVAFDLAGAGVVVPDELIYGVAFDTQLAGAAPRGVPGPYDALHVGVANSGSSPPPRVGSDVEPDYTFLDSDLAGWYCDGGAGGVDTFRRDGCWNGITPAIRIELGADDSNAPPDGEGRSVTAGGWWTDGGHAGEPFHLGVTARRHPQRGRLTGSILLRMAAAGLPHLRVSELERLVIDGEHATLVGRAGSGTSRVEVRLVLGDGTGPDGEDTVDLLVREDRAGGAVLYDSGGPRPLGGGSVRIHH
jgi:hypothetical protein